ncbi:MAG TPA: hypothetical protein VJQ82_15705 [Terriglobales bacterium]|nr:hypothetical protein [Terriglobales bacterium]
MTKSISALFFVTVLLAQPSPAPQPHLYPGRTGLTLIALANDGFALATDGAQFNADGTISEVQKIFPIGKTGAAVLAGQVSVQDPVTRPVREEFNAARVTELWLNAHHDATFETATQELNSLILQAANRFFSTRDPGRAAGTYKFALLFVEFKDGKPALYGTRYFMPAAPGQAMRATSITATPHPGEIWVFGLVKTTQELLAGNSATLKKYKADPALVKLRASRSQVSAQYFLSAFDVALQAAESPDGQKFDSGRSVIAPPNRLATITNDGFSFGKKSTGTN